MTYADIGTLSGYALSLWALGFGLGLIVSYTRKFTEKI